MTNADPFSGLEPPGLWNHFRAFTGIPRESGHEERMVEYLLSWAAGRGYETARDQRGNLCVRVPASPGRESAPVVVLQGHLDMVCVRDEQSPYDPAQGRIHVQRDGDWLRAAGTTLGADNGVAVAAMLHVAEVPDALRPRLDLLFTVDEEVGMTGASRLDPSMLRGRILLNLDTEEDGVLCVGSAGGCDSTMRWTGPREPAAAGGTRRRVSIAGLRGGHSGVEIDKGRANAVHCLVRILHDAAPRVPLRLWAIEGGNKRNAIPFACWADVGVPADAVEALQREVRQAGAALARQYAGIEPRMTVEVADPATQEPAHPWSDSGTRRILHLVRAIPAGVLAMSQKLPGLVETSTNLAAVHTRGDELEILSSSRSSSEEALRDVLATHRALAGLGGAAIEVGQGYPGWEPDLASPILGLVKRVHQRVLGADPAVNAVHAGLECGVLKAKIPDMDVVSFGPDILDAHAAGERVRPASVKRFWDLLLAVLDEVSR